MQKEKCSASEIIEILQNMMLYLRSGVLTRDVFERMKNDFQIADYIVKEQALGASIPVALSRVAVAKQKRELLIVAAVWEISLNTGAQLEPVLQRVQNILLNMLQIAQKRQILLAAPRLTVKIIMFLPAVSLLLGYLMGFDVIRVYFSVLGCFLLICGGAFYYSGIVWIRKMIKKVVIASASCGLDFELTALALAGGAPVSYAMRIVVDLVDKYGLEEIGFSGFLDNGRVAKVIKQAVKSGHKVSDVLSVTADIVRRAEITELTETAEKLGVRVLMPIGLCVLPGFIVTAIVPITISMFGMFDRF